MAYKGTYKAKDESYFKELILNFIPTEPTHMNSKQLSKYVNLNARDIRLLIQKLRDDGYPICGTPYNGYWMARTSWDMNETMKKLQNHIDSCQMTLDALMNCQRKLRESENLEVK